MSSLNDEADAANRPYNSLASLREAHTQLLKRSKEGQTEEVLTEIETFVRRACATGTVLDNENDRYAAQSLLDYWVTVIYKARRNMADATLEDFDPSLAPKLDDSLCPYRGLNAFQEEDKDLFFGRRRLIEALVEKTKETRLIFVVGPSGSGKSSLVLAGLIPTLKNGALPESKSWQYFPRIVPGPEPLKSLATALNKIYGQPAEWVSQQSEKLKQDPGQLLNTITSGGSAPAVLIVDQFEEVFTLCTDDESRDAFINNLVALTEATGPRHLVILTLRTDFETYLVQNQTLMSLFEKGQVRVMPLTATDLRDAIEEPARRIGLKFEDGVVDALVKDILGEPAGLPLLQFALLRLWKMREDGRNRITLQNYRKLGGARRALALTADDFYQALSDEKQITAKRILLRLARPSGNAEVTSNPVKRSTLYFEAPYRVDEVLNELCEAGLVRITKGETKESDKVEVAHEALVRNWGTLVDWIEKDRASMRQRLRLTASAEQWLEHGKDVGGLLGGSLLEEAFKYDDLNDLEKEFVRASKASAERAEQEKEEARQREKELEQENLLALQQKNEAIARNATRLRLFLIISAILSLFSFVAAGYAISNSRQAKRDAARATANELRATAQEAEAKNQTVIANYLKEQAKKASDSATEQKNEALKQKEYATSQKEQARIESEKAKEQERLAQSRRQDAEHATKRALDAEKKATANAGELKTLREQQEELSRKRNDADAYMKRGRFDKAIDLYAQIFPKFEAANNSEDLEHVMSELARAFRALEDKHKRRGEKDEEQQYHIGFLQMHDKALDLFNGDLEEAKKAKDPLGIIYAHERLAQFYVEHGEPNDAEPHYLEALKAQEQLIEMNRKDPEPYNYQVDKLAEYYRSQNKFEKLVAFYNQVLEAKKRIFGETNKEVYDSLRDLAKVYHDQGKNQEAESRYREAMRLAQGNGADIQSDQEIRLLVQSNNDLGDLYQDQGANDQAETYYKQALKFGSGMRTAQDQMIMAEIQARLADVLRKQSKNDEALTNYKEAIEIFKRDKESNALSLASSYNAVGEIYLEQTNPDSQQQAKDSFMNVQGVVNVYSDQQAEKDELARALINLASVNYARPEQNRTVVIDPPVGGGGDEPSGDNRIKYADELVSRARLISPNAQAMESRILQRHLDDLGKNFAQKGANEDESTYEEVLKQKEDKINAGDLAQVESAEVVIHGLEGLYRAQGNYEKLVALYKRALDIRIKEHNDASTPDVYKTYNDIGELYLYLKDYKNAEVTYQKALDIVERVFENDQSSAYVVASLLNLANVYSEQAKYAQAELLYKQAMLNLENGQRKNTVEMADILERYAEVLQNTKRATEANKLKEDAKTIRSNLMSGSKKN
jgi:tetratricopeptide (TPR) repeat protein/energy-coupling factor transporter ATP-binding protein EcfA2